MHLTYSAAGLATVVVHSVAWMTGIKLLGGAYLIFLGVKGLRARALSVAPDGADSAPFPASPSRQVCSGFLCNALNPKAPIYFLSLFTVVLSPGLPLLTLTLYGGWIMVLQVLWFSTVTLCFTHTAVRARFLALGHWIDRAFGVAMVALGVRVLVSAPR